MSKCRHTSANWSRWEDGAWVRVSRLSGPPLGEAGRFFKDRLVCDVCGHWIHLGPAAADTPEVTIEKRAAELAQDWSDHAHSPGYDRFDSCPSSWDKLCDMCQVSYLARCIAAHEEG